jgi:arylsulfatase A-like enzyme
VTQQLPSSEATIAETLRSAGYRTAIIGKDEASPAARGFDMHIPTSYETGWLQTYCAPFKLNGDEDEQGQYLIDDQTDEALRYIEAGSEHPFFFRKSIGHVYKNLRSSQ